MQQRLPLIRPTLRKLRRGFTMIELVVVMAAIGLLLSIALPRYLDALERGKLQVQHQNLAQLRDAIDKYYGDNGKYPDSLDDLVTKKYLRAIPVDPVVDAPVWTVVAPKDPGMGSVYDVRSTRDTAADTAARSTQ